MSFPRGSAPERQQLNEVILELQKIKTRLAHTDRLGGEISDVKYDKDKKRWYAKYKENAPTGEPFETDWRPWKSFSHGSISVSMPPRVGMKATMRSPGGYPEQSYIEAHHYGPDNPSPHDQQDEVVIQIQKPKQTSKDQDGKEQTTGGANTPNEDDSPTLRIHAKNDTYTMTVGKVGSSKDSSASNGDGSDGKSDTTFQMTLSREGKTITCGKFKAVLGKKGAKLSYGDDISIELNDSQIKHTVSGATHTITKDNIVAQLGDSSHTLTNGDFKVAGGTIHHDDRNIGKSHVHSGVLTGGSKTQAPDP